MQSALSDFVIYCRIERRLAELTRIAYECVVRNCVEFVRSQGIRCAGGDSYTRPSCVPGRGGDTIVRRRRAKRRRSWHCLASSASDRSELTRLLDIPGKAGVGTPLHVGKVERDRLLLAQFAYGDLWHSELLGLDLDHGRWPRSCGSRSTAG